MFSANRISITGFIALAVVSVGAFSVFSTAGAVTLFSTTETTANVASSSIPAVTFAGGADTLGTTTITAGALSGGVNPVSETLAAGNVTITAGTTGSVTSLTVDGVELLNAAVPFNADINTTAADVAASINATTTVPDYTVSAVGTNVITITALADTGANPNGFVVNATVTGDLAFTKSNLSGGIDGVAEVKSNTTTSSFAAATSQAGADLTLNIGGTSITLLAGESGAETATRVASQITTDGDPYTATVVSTDQVKISAIATGTTGDGALVASDLDYNAAPAIPAMVTVTVSAGLVANAFDHSVTIDGVTIDLGTSALTASQVAAAIAANGFAGKDYTVTNPSGADLTFTKKSAGAAGNGALTLQDAAYGAKAQIVDYTPNVVTVGYTYDAEINGAHYTYFVQSGDTAKEIVEALNPLMDANGAVTCTENDVAVTCTADTAGTAFIHSALAHDITGPVIVADTAVTTPTNDTTPDYKFFSTEAGTITYGGDCSSGTTAAVAGTTTVTFNALGAGTHSNCTVKVTDAATNDSNTLNVNSFVIDTTAPTVAITSTKSNGYYNAGTDINVTLTFSEAVTSTDALTVTLETGATDRTCLVSALTSSTIGTCTYTVQAGDTSADLTINSIVVDNAGTIKDLATNSANLTPTSNIADTSDIVIDTTAPLISSVSYSPTSGNLAIGDIVTVTVQADASGYTSGTFVVNGVAVTGFTDNLNTTYTAVYTIASGNADIANGGTMPVSVTLVDAATNQTTFSTPPDSSHTPTIDANAPAAPSTPDLAAASDSGSSSTDNTTASTTPVFSGTAEVGSTVNLHAGATFVGSAVASSGTWSITSSALADGVYAITATATDVAGNIGATSTALSVTIDTTPPVVGTPDLVTDTGISNTDDLTNNVTPTFTGTGDSSSVKMYDTDGTTQIGTGFASGGTWSIVASTLSAGAHTVKVRGTDLAGNVGAFSSTLTITIDTQAPTLAEVTPVPPFSTNHSPAYTFSSTESGTIAYNGSCVSGTGLATTGSNTVTFNSPTLVDGTYASCTVAVTDDAGNTSSTLTASTFTIDNTAPVVDSVTFNDSIIFSGNMANVVITINTTEAVGVAGLQASLTDGSVTALASFFSTTSPSIFTATFEASSLADGIGNITARVTATDASGNTSGPQTATISKDTTAPVITLSGSATTSVALGNAYAEPGYSALDAMDGAITPVVTGTVDTNVAGTYTLTYTATDTHSNVSTVTRKVVVSSSTLSITTTSNPDTTKSGILTNGATSTATSGTTVMSVDVPAGTTVTGDSSWDGTLSLPTVSTSYTSPTPVSGTSINVRLALEVGSSTAALTFNKGVRILFPGMSGERVGWSRNGVFTEITTTCTGNTQVDGDALADGADCKIDSGADLVVWTKHFTAFLVFTQFTSSSSSGGSSGGSGGGGGGGSSAAFNPTPAAPASQGQVLGASAYNFTKDFGVGSRGTDVTELQKMLITGGFLKISEPTGTFGPLTLAAVQTYQTAHGVTPQSGYVGPKTRAVLNQGTTPGVSDEQRSLLIQSLQEQVNALIAKLKTLLGQ